jgi:PST family polysaccharide transporter
MVLEQRGSRFDVFVGPVFWMMLALNTVTAVVIAAMARPVARLYDIPELAGVIQLFAISIPLSVVPSVLGVRLAVNLRFRELSTLQVISAMNRNLLLIFFAWDGFGPRSFLLPLLITNVIDSGMFWAVTRYSPWTRHPNFPIWPELFRSGRWVLLGTFAIGIGNNGAYLLLGKILPSAVVGIFFFSYQLVIQLGTLLSDNVYQVLVPIFVRIANDAPRVRAAVPRALTVVVLIGAAASLSIAAIYEPLERALWHGKWSASSHSIYVLAAMWPAVAGVSVLRALQMATGRFQSWGLVTISGAAMSIAGTAAGAYVGRGATAAPRSTRVTRFLAWVFRRDFCSVPFCGPGAQWLQQHYARGRSER